MQAEFNGSQTSEGKEQFNESNSNLDAQIDALLSPEQRVALKQSRQRETEALARMDADSKLFVMQSCAATSRAQEEQVLPILYDFALRRRTDNPTNADETDALARVLTPAQMLQYSNAIQGTLVRIVVVAGDK